MRKYVHVFDGCDDDDDGATMMLRGRTWSVKKCYAAQLVLRRWLATISEGGAREREFIGTRIQTLLIRPLTQSHLHSRFPVNPITDIEKAHRASLKC